MEQLKVGDIGYIYAPSYEKIHLRKCKIIKINILIKVELLDTKERCFIEFKEFVKSELYNNPKPMKPKTKPVAKKATPKQVWRPLGEYEKVYKGDVLRKKENTIYSNIGNEVEVSDNNTTSAYFNCKMIDGVIGEYRKSNFLIARPFEVNVQYLRSDGLLFTKDKIGDDDVTHLKNEHKRIGDLLSAHKKYFK